MLYVCLILVRSLFFCVVVVVCRIRSDLPVWNVTNMPVRPVFAIPLIQ